MSEGMTKDKRESDGWRCYRCDHLILWGVGHSCPKPLSEYWGEVLEALAEFRQAIVRAVRR